MDYMFKEKVVWITGASSGIGREMALQFAAKGAKVAVSARRKERLEELVKEIEKSGGSALAVPCNVTDENEVQKTVERLVEHYKRLDIAVANAGFGVGGKIENLAAEDWRRQMEVNVVGLTSTAKQALPYLKKSNGSIVLIGSVASMVSSPNSAPYTASKAAVRAIGQVLSMELYGSGVTCTTIHPGYIESEIGKVDKHGEYHADWHDQRPAALVVPTGKAVKAMLIGIEKKKREIVITRHGKILSFLGRHFPGMVHWATVKKIIPGINHNRI